MGAIFNKDTDVVEKIILKDYKSAKKAVQADLVKCANKFKTAIAEAFSTLESDYKALQDKEEGFAEAQELLKSRYNVLAESHENLDEMFDEDYEDEIPGEVQTFIDDYEKFAVEVEKWTKCKGDIKEAYTYLNHGLVNDGRDAFFYRSIFKKYKEGLLGDLNGISGSTDPADSGGIFADVGLALKRVPMDLFTHGLGFDDIMPAYLVTGSNHIRGIGDVHVSQWATDLATSKLKGSMGPSRTTTQLLVVSSSIGGFTDKQIEAMMIALVKFWGKKLKRSKYGKGFHTAVEVWAPYTGYLEARGG